MIRYVLAAVAVCVAAALVGAAEPERDDIAFLRMVKKTSSAAREMDFTKMLQAILSGSQMGPNDGWFKPSETRYDWKWLSSQRKPDAQGRISPKEFAGPADLFMRLDRDRDGFITAGDFDWSDAAPYMRQFNQARQWLRLMDNDGAITREEWNKLFDKLAQGKAHLSADDVRSLLNPTMPPPPKPSAGPPPGAGMPPMIVLLQGLLTGELGSLFEGPKLGQRAPDFTLATHDARKTITLSKFRNHKPVVLVFGSFT